MKEKPWIMISNRKGEGFTTTFFSTIAKFETDMRYVCLTRDLLLLVKVLNVTAVRSIKGLNLGFLIACNS